VARCLGGTGHSLVDHTLAAAAQTIGTAGVGMPSFSGTGGHTEGGTTQDVLDGQSARVYSPATLDSLGPEQARLRLFGHFHPRFSTLRRTGGAQEKEERGSLASARPQRRLSRTIKHTATAAAGSKTRRPV
jgi:hypothetical protein